MTAKTTPLTTSQREALSRCYRFIIGLARKQKAAEGQAESQEPTAASDPGETPETGEL
jgi:hypothetical protein